MNSTEAKLFQEIENLKSYYKNREYLSVVVLAPQLIVQIIDLWSSYSDEWIERKITRRWSDDEKEVYRLAGQQQRKESDRSYIIGGLVGLFESGHWPEGSGKANFIKYFTKLDDLISLRNIYAHEYYEKNVSTNRAKNCASTGIQLAELFSTQLYMEAKNV